MIVSLFLMELARADEKTIGVLAGLLVLIVMVALVVWVLMTDDQ